MDVPFGTEDDGHKDVVASSTSSSPEDGRQRPPRPSSHIVSSSLQRDSTAANECEQYCNHDTYGSLHPPHDHSQHEQQRRNYLQEVQRVTSKNQLLKLEMDRLKGILPDVNLGNTHRCMHDPSVVAGVDPPEGCSCGSTIDPPANNISSSSGSDTTLLGDCTREVMPNYRHDITQQYCTSSDYESMIEHQSSSQYQQYTRQFIGNSDERYTDLLKQGPISPSQIYNNAFDETFSSSSSSVGCGCNTPHHYSNNATPYCEEHCESSSDDEMNSIQIIDRAKRTDKLMDDFKEYLSKLEMQQTKKSSSNSDKKEDHPPILPQKQDPPSERVPSSSLYRNRRSSIGDVEGIKAKNQRVRTAFDDLRGSLGTIQRGSPTLGTTSPPNHPNVGTTSPISRRQRLRRRFSLGTTPRVTSTLSRRSRPKRRVTDTKRQRFTDTNQLLWENEMNFFKMTSGMNNGEDNIHEQFDNNGSGNKKERHRRYSNARGVRCSSPTCERRAWIWNVMVTCAFAIVGCLIAITFGSVTMEKKKDLRITSMFRYEGASDKLPNWFDRSSSKWKGQTYAEAVDFCTSNNQMLCPYETICPFGPGGEAVGVGSGGFGSVEEDKDNPYALAWVAINNAPNAWAHVGSKDHCLKYDFIHSGSPAWGVTGEENEEITRHIVCCNPPPIFTRKKAKKNALNDPTDDTSPIVHMNQPLDNVWYTRSDGWQGSTFDEALTFCGTKGKKHFPCPYEAYCPNGPHFPPVERGPTTKEGYSKDENKTSSWSPIVDETGNGIVQVASDGNDKICKVYHLPLEDDMLSGREGLEDTMTHVMCCQLVDDNNQEIFG